MGSEQCHPYATFGFSRFRKSSPKYAERPQTRQNPPTPFIPGDFRPSFGAGKRATFYPSGGYTQCEYRSPGSGPPDGHDGTGVH